MPPRVFKVPRLPMQPRPWAIVGIDLFGTRIDTSDGRVLRDVKVAGDGIHAAHGQGFLLYSLMDEERLAEVYGHHRVAAKVRHNRYIRFYLDYDQAPDGAPVITSSTPELYPLNLFGDQGAAGVVPWFRWCERQGIAAASLGTMAKNLWLSTFEGKADPTFYNTVRGGQLAQQALVGGRKEAHPEAPGQRYRDYWYADLKAAYPSAMAGAPFPTAMQKVELGRRDPWPECGYALAEVRLRRMAEWGPLPVGVARGVSTYLREPETVRGCWSFADLSLARDMGARVRLLEAWKGLGMVDLFGPWWDLMQEARAMNGEAGRVAKHASTRLWGQFAMSDEAPMIRTRQAFDGPLRIDQEPGHRMPVQHTAHVAVETAARVRVRLAREMLYPEDAVYCDTDGAIVPAGTVMPVGWAIKEKLRQVEIKASQVYRWTCPDCECDLDGAERGDDGAHDGPHYSIAGVEQAEAARVWLTLPVGVYQHDELYELTVPSAPLAALREQYQQTAGAEREETSP